jgi:periplasmic protein TonB
MSYVTQKQRANPAGLFGAIVINGGVVLAALTMATVVIPGRAPDIRPKTFDVPVQKPPKEDVKKDPAVETPRPNPVFVERPFVDIIKPLDDSIGTTDEVMTIPTFTEPLGEQIAISGGTKDVIEQAIPKPIFRPAIRDPKYANKFQPRYPAGLLSKNIEGKVVLKILIGADGLVRQANVISATHEDFGTAAVDQALKSWRFKPATRDGKPVEDWQTLTIRFNIGE